MPLVCDFPPLVLSHHTLGEDHCSFLLKLYLMHHVFVNVVYLVRCNSLFSRNSIIIVLSPEMFMACILLVFVFVASLRMWLFVLQYFPTSSIPPC